MIQRAAVIQFRKIHVGESVLTDRLLNNLATKASNTWITVHHEDTGSENEYHQQHHENPGDDLE